MDSNSDIADVVATVAGALKRGGIDAVLTGGARVSIYSEGQYFPRDFDFIIVSDVTVGRLDDAAVEPMLARKWSHHGPIRRIIEIGFRHGCGAS